MSGVLELDEAVGAAGGPVWLAFEPDPVLAFLHLPELGQRRSTAVLLCPPFGWEEMCSYRARRKWAQSLAEAGYPAARIDLPGTGDSAGSPADPERLDAWTTAVSSAADWLRERAGSERVALIGIGLGGIVACLVAARGAAIDDLILWAAPAQGRTLLRELRAHAGVVAARYPADSESGPPLPEGALELTGFLMSAETAAALEGLQLPVLPQADAADRRVLLLRRDGLGVDSRLRAHFERSGTAVTVTDTRDYSSLMAHPQAAQMPLETIAETVSWLGRGEAAHDQPSVGDPLRSMFVRTSGLERDSVELTFEGAMVRETPLRFNLAGEQVFAMLSEPVGVSAMPVCGVLLNAGALRHTGPNRTWVEIGRRWAARGVPTLRVDLKGIGDSGGDEGTLVTNPALYAPESTEQVLSLLDQLGAHGLPSRFVLAGLCSGAYWSLHAALAEPRVAGVFMINLWAFYWDMALVAERQTSRALSALGARGWRRLMRRDVTVEDLVQRFQSIRPARLRARSGHPVERGQKQPVELAFDTLLDQGTEALLLLSEGAPLRAQLVRNGHLEGLVRWPNLTIETIPSRDHTFRALWLQRQVRESLDRALERVLDAVPGEQQRRPR